MHRIPSRPLTFAVSILGLLSTSTTAQLPIPLSDEFQVNLDTTDRQTAPALAALDDGRFVVVWESRYDATPVDPDTSFESVHGRLFDGDGVGAPEQFRVNSTTAGEQYSARVAGRQDGSFVVVWSDQSGGNDVAAQRFLADGTPAGAELRVNQATAGSQFDADVAADPHGGFVVVWTSDGPTGYDRVDGGVFGATGSTPVTEFVASDLTTSNNQSPSIAMAGDGSFHVAWAFDDNYFEIRARSFDDSGVPSAGSFQVDTTTGYGNYRPRIAHTGDDPVVAWSHESIQSGAGLRAQRIEASTGVLLGPELIPHLSTSLQQSGSVAQFEDGSFVVVWVGNESLDSFGSPLDTDGSSIQMRLFDPAGVAIGTTELQVNQDTANPQTDPEVLAQPDGSFVVVWSGFDLSSSSRGIRGRRFGLDSDADGIANPLDNCPFTSNGDQADADLDDEGDVCDECTDTDGDGFGDPGFPANTCDDDTCPGFDDNLDVDGDGLPNGCDLCFGDNGTGDADGDGLCADRDCDEADPTNTSAACRVFGDGFETGDTSAWSLTGG